jgi:uncharacterized membrane protein YhhN
MSLPISIFVFAAALLSMVFMALSQRLVDWKHPSRSCPVCGRDLDRDCRCRPRLR